MYYAVVSSKSSLLGWWLDEGAYLSTLKPFVSAQKKFVKLTLLKGEREGSLHTYINVCVIKILILINTSYVILHIITDVTIETLICLQSCKN